MMTLQQIFDKVARHLLTQMKQSRTELGSCAYRGADNTMCAVGCLIEDKHYKRTIEFKGARDTNVQEILVKSGILEAVDVDNYSLKTELLARLQVVHDSNQPSAWKELLVKLANDCGLDPKVLREFA
jgi:hypothetical protein